MPFDFVARSLQERRENGLYREQTTISAYDQQFVVVEGKRYCNFSGNDYLGLAQATHRNIANAPAGSTGSPVVTGYSSSHQTLCDTLAEQLNREAVLLFSSGFAANAGVCQALGNSGASRFFCDRLVHASMIDGVLASQCQFTRFRHNDVAHLTTHLTKSKKREHTDNLVLTEGVFSMDGDVAPLHDIAPLASQHNAALYLDDAHGFGILGEHGLGCVEHFQLTQQQLPVLMATFGKAIGASGAFVAGSLELINYLRNFCRHYIYSTALSPAQVTQIMSNLTLCRTEHWRREKLFGNIALFKQLMTDCSFTLLPSSSPIQPVIIGNPERASAVAHQLREQGFWITAIRSPTVPQNTDRLRITLSSLHDSQDIQNLTEALVRVADQAERGVI